MWNNMHKIQFYHNRNIKQYQNWHSKNNRKFFHIPLRFEQVLSLNKDLRLAWPAFGGKLRGLGPSVLMPRGAGLFIN